MFWNDGVVMSKLCISTRKEVIQVHVWKLWPPLNEQRFQLLADIKQENQWSPFYSKSCENVLMKSTGIIKKIKKHIRTLQSSLDFQQISNDNWKDAA